MGGKDRFLQQKGSFICFSSKLLRSLLLFLLLFLLSSSRAFFALQLDSRRFPKPATSIHFTAPFVFSAHLARSLSRLPAHSSCFSIVSPSSSALVRVVSFEFLSLSIISHPTYIFIFNVGSSGTPRSSSAYDGPFPYSTSPQTSKRRNARGEVWALFFFSRKSLNCKAHPEVGKELKEGGKRKQSKKGADDGLGTLRN